MMSSLPRGHDLRWFDEVESTNSTALELARQDKRDRLWIIARRQTAGRGSRGRSWVGMDGNLFCSLLLIDPADIKLHSQLTFVISLAVYDAVAEQGAKAQQRFSLGLKWPNDVLLNEKKVCGILLESNRLDDQYAVVAGVGINCAAHPRDTNWPATNLYANGIKIAPEEMLECLAGHVENWLCTWNGGDDFSTIRQTWLSRAVGLGEFIRVETSGALYEGVFRDLDAHGRLLLRLGDGTTKTLSAADIFFPQQTISGF